MTENKNLFVRKNKDADLEDGWRVATRKYRKMEKQEQTPKEVRKKAEELRDKNKEIYKSTKDARFLGIIEVISEYIGIFEKIEEDFEDIVLGLRNAYGSDKVDFGVHLLKVRHPCFHMDLGTNTVAMNPKIYPALKGSTIELTVPLEIPWEKLFEHMRGKKEIMHICSAYCYGELFSKLEAHKEQLKSMIRIVPKFLSRYGLDSQHPHLTVEIGWDENMSAKCAYYSDLFDFKNILDKEEINNLPLQILRPITVESDRWEVIPLIIPVSLEEKYPTLIEDIKNKIEIRFAGCGEVRSGDTIYYEHEISNIVYSSLGNLRKITARKFGGFDIKTINALLKEQVFKADIEINCGLESCSWSGDSSSIGDVMEKRQEQHLISNIYDRNPSCDVTSDIPEEIGKSYIKEFDKFKKRMLGT